MIRVVQEEEEKGGKGKCEPKSLLRELKLK
jgi:hypothetical protein